MTDEEYRNLAITQFFSHVDQHEFEDLCWNWIGPLKNGYGAFYFDNECYVAHRFSYIILFGMFDQNLEVDHLCRNTFCVNPYHLEAVTKEENLRRSGLFFQANLTAQCKRGHDYTEENTRTRTKDGHIYRSCRICERLRKKTRQILGREAARKRRRRTERLIEDPEYKQQLNEDQRKRRDKNYVSSLTDVQMLELFMKLKGR